MAFSNLDTLNKYLQAPVQHNSTSKAENMVNFPADNFLLTNRTAGLSQIGESNTTFPNAKLLNNDFDKSGSSTARQGSKKTSPAPIPLGVIGEDLIPPASGDWIIDSETIVYDESITLNGSLLIQNGGNLTLQNG